MKTKNNLGELIDVSAGKEALGMSLDDMDRTQRIIR